MKQLLNDPDLFAKFILFKGVLAFIMSATLISVIVMYFEQARKDRL